MKTLLTLVAALGALAVPAAAQADTLVVPAPGATDLAAGGGFLAWLQPPLVPGGLALVVRRPDGTLASRPAPGAGEPSIGSTGGIDPTRRELSVVFSRDGDLHRADVTTGAESRIAPISSRAYEEADAVLQYGSYVFARSGGRRNGIYRYRPGRPSVRVVSTVPTTLAANGSRVAYAGVRTVVVRRLSNQGSVLRFRSPAPVADVLLTRYRVIWLTEDGRVFQSERFGGSSGPRDTVIAREGRRRLPSSTNSIAGDGSTITTYLDADGVKSISPPLF